MPQMATLSIH